VPKGGFTTRITDYFQSVTPSARINYGAGSKGDISEWLAMTDNVDIIFRQKHLVTQLFSDPGMQDTADHKYGIEQYKYLAHVRNVNTEGSPDAGLEELGFFSIVIASRTGALRGSKLVDSAWEEQLTPLSQPRTQICHLSSIEHLDSTIGS
jgi:hypothetical protein